MKCTLQQNYELCAEENKLGFMQEGTVRIGRLGLHSDTCERDDDLQIGGSG